MSVGLPARPHIDVCGCLDSKVSGKQTGLLPTATISDPHWGSRDLVGQLSTFKLCYVLLYCSPLSHTLSFCTFPSSFLHPHGMQSLPSSSIFPSVPCLFSHPSAKTKKIHPDSGWKINTPFPVSSFFFTTSSLSNSMCLHSQELKEVNCSFHQVQDALSVCTQPPCHSATFWEP